MALPGHFSMVPCAAHGPVPARRACPRLSAVDIPAPQIGHEADQCRPSRGAIVLASPRLHRYDFLSNPRPGGKPTRCPTFPRPAQTGHRPPAAPGSTHTCKKSVARTPCTRSFPGNDERRASRPMTDCLRTWLMRRNRTTPEDAPATSRRYRKEEGFQHGGRAEGRRGPQEFERLRLLWPTVALRTSSVLSPFLQTIQRPNARRSVTGPSPASQPSGS
jgi:hypothetical protein